MATIQDLAKKVASAKSRQTSAFVRETTEGAPDTYAFYNFGRIKNANLTFEPVTDEADTAGRDAVLSFDITAQFVVQQTSATEIAVMGDLASPSGYDKDNGHFLFFSDEPQSTSTVYDDDGTGIPPVDGFGFENALLKPTLEVQFDGTESMISIEFSGRVTVTALDNFDTTDGHVITLDA